MLETKTFLYFKLSYVVFIMLTNVIIMVMHMQTIVILMFMSLINLMLS